jgi:hypothetical protein
MPGQLVNRMIVVGIFCIALVCPAQKTEPIPPEMIGTSGTIVGFLRDTACLLCNKDASVVKDSASAKCVAECVRAGTARDSHEIGRSSTCLVCAASRSR